MSLFNFLRYLVLLLLFLLPWQTRILYAPAQLNGGFWEYGSQSFYATEVLLWVIMALFCIWQFRERARWPRVLAGWQAPGQRKKIIGYLLVAAFFGLAIVASLNWKISLQWVFHLAGGAALAVMLWSLGTEAAGAEKPGFSKKMLLAFWLGGVVQGVLAAWQFFAQEIAGSKWFGTAFHSARQLGDFVVEFGDERWLRAYGAFGSPNILGGFLALVYVVGLIIAVLKISPRFSEPEKKLAVPPSAMSKFSGWEIFIAAGQLVVLAGLVFSFSRGAWLSALAGTGILWLVAPGRRALRRQLVVALVFLIACFLLLWPLITTRLTVTGRLEQLSVTSRFSDYSNWWRLATTYPALLLTGSGPGTYTLLWHQQNPALPVWHYQPIHNSYLLVLTELGAPGLVFFVLLGILAARRFKRNRLFLPVVMVLGISALFDHFWWSLYGGILLWWAACGLASFEPMRDFKNN